jgi:hypothetical protein
MTFLGFNHRRERGSGLDYPKHMHSMDGLCTFNAFKIKK